MNPSKLRKRVAIQTNTPESVDAAGAPVDDWDTIATVWAEIDSKGGGQTWQGQQAMAEGIVKVRMRYNTYVAPQRRLLYGSRVFEINDVTDVDERHIEMLVSCRELLN